MLAHFDFRAFTPALCDGRPSPLYELTPTILLMINDRSRCTIGSILDVLRLAVQPHVQPWYTCTISTQPDRSCSRACTQGLLQFCCNKLPQILLLLLRSSPHKECQVTIPKLVNPSVSKVLALIRVTSRLSRGQQLLTSVAVLQRSQSPRTPSMFTVPLQCLAVDCSVCFASLYTISRYVVFIYSLCTISCT